ncbi:MAG TPA: pyridoxal-dependent decarboxylase [Gemmatimonadales bacterium]|nr:pyridoxal-dependent decarboxylase [Gemmatimonadales bacterium]
MTDPDLSADDFAAALARAARMAERYLRELPTREAFRRPPDNVVERFRDAPLPQTGIPSDEILADIECDVLPYSLGIGHPRWWGFIRPSPVPLGMAADLLSATMNNNCSGSAQIATYVEMTVVRWLAELLGYDPHAGGLLMSGGSAANFVALSAMRETLLPGTRTGGLRGLEREPAIYVTRETHSCIRRAVEMLGLGSDALRFVPVDAALRMDADALAEMVAADRARGAVPLAVVATAGTVNTGAIDPLERIAEIARDESLWYHVDGAYGGVGAALPELAELYRGLALADSIAIDPHKWLYVPYEAGAVLVRERDALQRAFATKASYLEVGEDDYFNGPLWFHQQGPQLSRGFRALKVWAVMRQIGVAGYRALWRKDIAAATELRRLVTAHPQLEALGTSPLSICCFRYVPERGDADLFNRRLLNRIQVDGRVFVSGTTVHDQFCLRACIVNFHTTPGDVRLAVEAIVELGEKLEGKD